MRSREIKILYQKTQAQEKSCSGVKTPWLPRERKGKHNSHHQNLESSSDYYEKLSFLIRDSWKESVAH